jgi:hypothetical protein
MRVYFQNQAGSNAQLDSQLKAGKARVFPRVCITQAQAKLLAN